MKRVIQIISMICVLLSSNTHVFANAGPTYWAGYPSSDMLLINENSPIEVLNEDLLFDFSNEEDNSYSLKGKVTAKYTMQNSSHEDIAVQMAFPFVGRFSEFSPEDIHITVDGENISNDTYLGDEVKDSTDFNMEQIIKSITKEKYNAKHFKENEIGKVYQFKVEPTKENTNFEVSFNFDHEKTKIITSGFNGFERHEDNTIKIFSGAREEALEVYVMGEDIDFDIRGYLAGSPDQETELEYKLTTENRDVESYLKELADYYLKKYEVNDSSTVQSHVSEVQLYNLYAQSLDQYLEQHLGICTEEDFMSTAWSSRIMTFVYTVDFPKYSKKEISINYNINGSMDRRETVEPQFKYDYILNPASHWKGFKDLNIKIITPAEAPYIIDSSIPLTKEDSHLYTSYLAELPDEDFSFTLYSKDKVTLSDSIGGHFNSIFGYFAPIVIGLVAIFIIIILVSGLRAYRKRKNK